MSVDDIADEIVAEALDGVDGTGVRIGLIGEIGVSADFTAAEEKSLRGAARAQRRTGAAADRSTCPAGCATAISVLDIVEEEGGDPAAHRALPHEPEPRRPRLPDEPAPSAAPSSNTT